MAKQDGCIQMLTDGEEERQFLYADDFSEFLLILSNIYNSINRNKSLHITSFEWATIMDIANIVSKEFGNCKIIPSSKKDTVQQNMRNEPDNYVFNFWKPKTSLQQGIRKIIGLMK